MTSVKPTSEGEDSVFRSVASLLLFIHLFCVVVVLGSNFRRSRLQSDLVRIFAVYTQLLNFDPDFTPYYFTFGRNLDDDTWLTVELYADANQPVASQTVLNTVRLPDGGTNWFGERRRYFRLAQILAANADPENENDDVTGEIARSVGARIIREHKAGRAVVRCVRRMSQPFNLTMLNPGFPADRPTDAAYDQMLYEADVWIDEDNQVQVLKRASRAEVAPRQSGTQQPSGGAASKSP
jgi:hypothetical protein